MTNQTNLGKVIYMNLVLTFHLSLCLGLASQLPLIASLNHYDSLGQVALISLYITNLTFNLLGPSYLTKFSYRCGFVAQALLSVPAFVPATLIANCDANNIEYTVCEPWLLYIITIAGCFLLGAGLGGYFVLQNTYISDCSDESNKELFFGIAYMLLGGAYLLNGIETDILLGQVGLETFFIYAGCVQVLFSLLFIFVPQPTKIQQTLVYDQVVPEQANIAQDSVDSSDIVPPQRQQLANEEFAKLPLRRQFSIMYEETFHIKMVHILPLFLATGCVIGYEFGFFYKIIQLSVPSSYTSEQITSKQASIFIAVGAGQVASGICNGVLLKLIGVFNNSIIYANVFQAMLILSVINTYVQSYSLNYLLGALIGFTDNSGQFNSVVFISEKWGDSMAIYGVYLFFQNFGVVLINVIAIFTDDDSLVIYNFIFLFMIQMAVKLYQQKFKRSYDI